MALFSRATAFPTFSLSSPACSMQLDRLIASPIEHLEWETIIDDALLMALSPRELRLMLVYFVQEDHDAYYALEVFDWLHHANHVDSETMELMAAITYSWIKCLVGLGDVAALLGEMDCVGLYPGFNLVEKAIALYWDHGERARVVEFVRDMLRKAA